MLNKYALGKHSPSPQPLDKRSELDLQLLGGDLPESEVILIHLPVTLDKQALPICSESAGALSPARRPAEVCLI